MPRIFAGNSAVLIGIVLAAVGLWLSRKFGNPYFDLGALVVIGLLLLGAVFAPTRKNDGPLSGEHIEQNSIGHVLEIVAADSAVGRVGQAGDTTLAPGS